MNIEGEYEIDNGNGEERTRVNEKLSVAKKKRKKIQWAKVMTYFLQQRIRKSKYEISSEILMKC